MCNLEPKLATDPLQGHNRACVPGLCWQITYAFLHGQNSATLKLLLAMGLILVLIPFLLSYDKQVKPSFTKLPAAVVSIQIIFFKPLKHRKNIKKNKSFKIHTFLKISGN